MINHGKPRFRADLPMRLEGVHIGVGPGVKAREQGLAFSLLSQFKGWKKGAKILAPILRRLAPFSTRVRSQQAE